jgi:TIR domain
MSDNYKYDVFLSYAHEDSTWCERLAERLHKAGVRVWFDRWQLRPGDHLLVKINEGLQNSRRMIAVWTSNYFRDSKLWTILEIFSRQHNDVLSVDRPLIPLMREACIVPPTLDNIITIDFTSNENFEDAFRVLVHSLDISITNEKQNPDLDSQRDKSINAENHELFNPYLTYSFGGIVADPAMFFGRQELLEEIKDQVCHAPTGRSFALYGHRRSGKSSILYHLKLQISQPCLPVIVNLGLLGVYTPDVQHPFIRLLLDDLRHALQDRVETRLSRWPTDKLISERPLDAFREALWAAEEILLSIGWNEPRVIFLIDEFSGLYEYIKTGLIPKSIMKQWKTLQEFGEFSAVIVGNDSMPMFMAEFPNDFLSIKTTVRLNYLTSTEMRRLADEPIRLYGKTRYRGNTLDRMWTLTGGSPYYTQIICAELVKHINERKALLITDVDLDEVLVDLIVGEHHLNATHFDPLIPLIGASVTQPSPEAYISILSAIAKASDLNTGAHQDDLPHWHNQAQIISDLISCGVIFADSINRLQIRIGLFTEWLRHN